MRFRKLPVVIEATQWHPGTDVAGVEPEMGAECDDPQCGDSTWDHACNAGGPTGRFIVRTLEGRMTVSPGDWIITGVKGERYPCKPDIFAKTYEPALLPENPAIAAERAKPREGEPAVHELKAWPRFYAEVLAGRKRFEVRRADRDFRPLDQVVLREWDPQENAFTGRACRKMIGYVGDLTGIGCPGFVGFEICDPPQPLGLSS